MSRSKGQDEKFCRSCGGIIKKKAEICPKCGVRPDFSGKENEYQESAGNSEILTKSNIVAGAGVIFLLAAFGALTSGGNLFVSIGQFLLYGSIGMLLFPQVRERIKSEDL